jgi:predicted oxidoreductase (fatty acid repression mutant protein)
MAGNEVPKTSDEQMACAEAVKKEYQTTKAQLVQKATANGTILSVDDTIAKRRLDEDFCRRWAACLSSNVKDASARVCAAVTNWAMERRRGAGAGGVKTVQWLG